MSGSGRDWLKSLADKENWAAMDTLKEWDELKAENTRLKEALEKLLDPETLARKIGDWDFAHNDDYFCFKFGGDGDNGEMLIDALAALLKQDGEL